MTHGHQRLAVFIRDSISVWVVEEADKIENLDQRQRSSPSHSGPENNVVIINIQMIINWIDLPNETLKFKVKWILGEFHKVQLQCDEDSMNPLLSYPFYPFVLLMNLCKNSKLKILTDFKLS